MRLAAELEATWSWKAGAWVTHRATDSSKEIARAMVRSTSTGSGVMALPSWTGEDRQAGTLRADIREWKLWMQVWRKVCARNNGTAQPNGPAPA